MRDNKFTFSSFIEITKLRLSVSVVFSSVISYLIGMSEFNFEIFSYLVLGGLMMVSASNIFNQVIERDLDALMQRTKGRPLPMGQISVNNALVLGFTFVIAGLTFLYLINPLCIYSTKINNSSFCFCWGYPWCNSIYAWLGSSN